MSNGCDWPTSDTEGWIEYALKVVLKCYASTIDDTTVT